LRVRTGKVSPELRVSIDLDLTYVRFIGSEAVVNAGWENDHVVLLELDSHPVVVLTPDVKVPLPATDVTDLLILVKMLIKEHLNFVLVYVAHLLRRHNDLVTVLVSALLGHLVDSIKLWKTVVKDADLLESFSIDETTRIVGKTLVTLHR
jgi:hypothetical protein